MDLNELHEIKEKELAGRKKYVLRCCMAAGCVSSASEGVKDQLEHAVQEAGLADEVEVRGVGCMKLCCEGPLVQSDHEGILYEGVNPDQAASIVAALSSSTPSCSPNSGLIDPERIESYIAADGYTALHQAITEMTPN
jgi:bidirectional [NiFe] hydrogenase diaphorase subunit